MVTEERPYLTPVFLLAPGRCFSSLACAMLGQHPEMYGLPETQLMVRDTLNEWWNDFGGGIHSHGLLRSVAEIVFGGQSFQNVQRAEAWLWQRRSLATHVVLSKLAAFVYPLTLVEKTPMVSYRSEHMHRILESFPNARFIHLVRHPIGYGESLIEFFRDRAPWRDAARVKNLIKDDESIFFRMFEEARDRVVPDPAEAWFIRQTEVLSFLRHVPDSQRFRIRGEDLISDPGKVLRRLCDWLCLRWDEMTLEEMQRPERWPFACFGPPNARHGGDPKFLRNPRLRGRRNPPASLESPVPWRNDGTRLPPHVQELAKFFDYV